MSKPDGYRILFVSAEVQPLMKTGGLADVSANLPAALRARGHDVRILTPAYAGSTSRDSATHAVKNFHSPSAHNRDRVLESRLDKGAVPVWLFDTPAFNKRRGSPYVNAHGHPYADNAESFNSLCKVAAWIAGNRAGLSWQPDIVHCNEWHTGLVPVWMRLNGIQVASIFTIHNLAYQGLFPRAEFDKLGLPAWLWQHQALEFHDQCSFMKGGLLFADYLTTVSPTFAREILDPGYGEGLDGVLRERADRLQGILNGLDTDTWNPEDDPLLERNYAADSLDAKSANKAAVRTELGLSDGGDEPLIAVIGRLAHQKGLDELLEALPDLLTLPVQFAILGSGDRRYEQALKKAAAKFRGRLSVHIGFDESLAHRLEAGADMLLMPSRFEPCGLTQMQSLRYGTVPVVARCGGLIDTVTDTTPASLADGSATGFFIDPLSPEEIVAAVQRAVGLFRRPQDWRKLMRQGMQQDFSWEHSARCYESVYHKAVAASRKEEPGVARPAG